MRSHLDQLGLTTASSPPRISRLVLRGAVSVLLLTAVVVAVFSQADASAVAQVLSDLPVVMPLLALASLLGGALLASARVKFVADDMGYRLQWRDALAALGVGQLGAALFFQIAGQLIGRGTYLARRGFPLGATVLMVGYERVLGLIVSLALAASGAWYIFGRIGVDAADGPGEMIKLAVGLLIAVGAGAWVAWGRAAATRGARFLDGAPFYRIARSVLLTVSIQLTTATAYVLLAYSLAPEIALNDIIAASFVVMFAAALPVSLAGWGVREMSAVVALGTVGVPLTAALITGALVGIGSLMVVAPMGYLAFRGKTRQPYDVPAVSAIDYNRLVFMAVPLAAATAVFFHVHLPTQAGGLNVNLADPFALLGGALFLVAWAVHRRSWPTWRLPGFNAHIIVATVIMAAALLIGAQRFGWTDWALTNKFLGWFVLLGYVATGALIVSAAGRDGLNMLLLTFAAAGAGIAALELSLVAVEATGISLPVEILWPDPTGFAQNRNTFAFQLLMVVAAAAVIPRVPSAAIAAIALAALWFVGSRAGWGTIAVLLCLGIYARVLTPRQVVRIVIWAAAIVLAINVVNMASSPAPMSTVWPTFELLDESTTTERLKSLRGGLDLFLQHPLFGAGLGSFIESEIRTTGTPLVIHSTPLWLLAEMGVVGLLAFLVPAIRIFRVALTSDDTAGRLLVLVISAFAVMSLPHEMFYQRTFWLLLGAGIACVAAKRQE